MTRISLLVFCVPLGFGAATAWPAETASASAPGDNQSAAAESRARFKLGLNAFLQKDYATAQRYWEPLAKAGDPVAAFNLGVMYARGHGVETDPARAAHWYQKAADADYALAQFNLGAAYMSGSGVKENHGLAAQWWARAAAKGHPRAMFNLGTLYLHGDGVPQDRERALNLIQKSADLGDTRAYQRLETLKDPSAPPPVVPDATAYEDRRQKTDPAAAPLQLAATGDGADAAVPQAPRTPAGRPAAGPKKTSPPAPAKVAAAAEPARGGNSGPGSAAPGGKRDTAFMARQDPQHWSIQMSAFTELAPARRFIRQHDIGAEAILIQATVKGRPWWKVMYGVYPDEARAKRALDGLPTPLRKRSPWARRIGVVHKELILETAGGQRVQPPPAPAAAAPPKAAPVRAPAPAAVTKTEKRGWRQKSVQTAAPPPPVSPVTAAPTPKPAPEPAPPPPAVTAAPPTVAPRKAPPPAQQDPGPATAAPSRAAPDAQELAMAQPLAGKQAAFQRGQKAFNDQDYDQALRIWSPLAQDGMGEAQYGLGFMYESGWGVKKDYVQAYRWYRRAAEQGHAKSQFNLGLLYQAGLGVPKNEALANYWIQSAADQDDARAKEFLRTYRRDGDR